MGQTQRQYLGPCHLPPFAMGLGSHPWHDRRQVGTWGCTPKFLPSLCGLPDVATWPSGSYALTLIVDHA